MLEFLENPCTDVYASSNYVVLDFETDTSGGDVGRAVHPRNEVILASYKQHDSDIISKWGGDYGQDDLLRKIEAADFIVAHNAKYELGHLKRMGLDLRSVLVFDTQLAEYVLMGNLAAGDETMIPRRTSLDDCCRRRGIKVKDPAVNLMMKRGINPTQIPRAWLQGRCEKDVIDTETLFLSQREQLKDSGRLGILLTRCLLSPVLTAMEFEGVRLDADRVQEEYDSYSKLLVELTNKMDAMTGGINWRSAKQAGAFLYNPPKETIEYVVDDEGEPVLNKEGEQETIVHPAGLGFKELTRHDRSSGEHKPLRTKAGAKKTDNATLDKLKATTKAQKEYLLLRKKLGRVDAALSKNLDFFVGVCKEKGGVFYGVFNQAKTATHRLSASGIQTKFDMYEKSKGVQFQNLPRVFKRLFRAKQDGWKLCEWDGSQLEFRVAAELSGDPQAVADILDPEFDAHLTTAAAMTQIPYEELKERYVAGDKEVKEHRQQAKSKTFAPLYGASKGDAPTERWYKAFKERYSSLSTTQQGWVFEVLSNQRKCLTLPWGMRFYWPRARMSNGGYCNVTTSVYNYPIQSFATAEIIPIAMVYFWHRLREAGLEDKVRMVNTVHDSVISEVHPDYVDEYKKVAINIWEDVYNYLEVVYGYVFEHVPLGTAVCVGDHWSEGNEVGFNIFKDGRIEEQS